MWGYDGLLFDSGRYTGTAVDGSLQMDRRTGGPRDVDRLFSASRGRQAGRQGGINVVGLGEFGVPGDIGSMLERDVNQ